MKIVKSKTKKLRTKTLVTVEGSCECDLIFSKGRHIAIVVKRRYDHYRFKPRILAQCSGKCGDKGY